MNRGMERAISPGLPSRPVLWIDRQRHRAIVKARFATWRSHEWAMRASWWMSVLVFVGLSVRWWQVLPNQPGKWFPFLIGVGVVGILVALLSPHLSAATHGFLARQVFAKRLTVWFTPQAIAFRGPLYANGIVINRAWNELKVICKFDLANDHEAQDYARRSASDTPRKTQHLEMARLLRILVSVGSRPFGSGNSQQTPSVRAIPVAEIGLLDAERMTTVLTAAAALTALTPKNDSGRPTAGTDIDAP